MKYANGTTIRVGDRVWWNEGIGTGFIQKIIERDEYLKEGYEEPMIFINYGSSNRENLERCVGYPERGILDDGVDPLTTEEEHEINKIEVMVLKAYPDLKKLEHICWGFFRKYPSFDGSPIWSWNVVVYLPERVFERYSIQDGSQDVKIIPTDLFLSPWY